MKLPLPHRHAYDAWFRRCAWALGSSDAGSHPEKWQVVTVDTARQATRKAAVLPGVDAARRAAAAVDRQEAAAAAVEKGKGETGSEGVDYDDPTGIKARLAAARLAAAEKGKEEAAGTVWREVHAQLLPGVATEKELHATVMRVLDGLAIDINLAMLRYERPERLYVFCIGAPAALLQRTIEAEAEANAVADPFGADGGRQLAAIKADMVEAWANAGLTGEMYERLIRNLTLLRGTEDPPLIVLHSTTDEKTLLCACHHYALLKDDAGIASLPRLGSATIIDYTVPDHPGHIEAPVVMCNNPKCVHVGGWSGDADIMRTYVAHRGPMRRELDAKKKSHAAALADSGEAVPDDAELETRVMADLYPRVKACTRCRAVSYCCRDCQAADWPRHKVVCKAPKE